MAVMNGFRAELLGRILGLNGHAVVYGQARRLSILIAGGESRRNAGRFRGFTAGRGQGHGHRRWPCRGCIGARAEPATCRPKPLGGQLSAAAVDNFAAGGVLLGGRLARRLGVSVGDQLTLVSPTSKPPCWAPCRAPTLSGRRVFDVGMYEYDNGLSSCLGGLADVFEWATGSPDWK